MDRWIVQYQYWDKRRRLVAYEVISICIGVYDYCILFFTVVRVDAGDKDITERNLLSHPTSTMNFYHYILPAIDNINTMLSILSTRDRFAVVHHAQFIVE